MGICYACSSDFSGEINLVPIVVMHGITDSAVDMEPLCEWIRKALPNVYVKNCEVGNGGHNSLDMRIDHQIELLRDCINSDPMLANGFIGLAHSQGGFLLRSYLELYNHSHYKMLRLVTLSSPLGGYFVGR